MSIQDQPESRRLPGISSGRFRKTFSQVKPLLLRSTGISGILNGSVEKKVSRGNTFCWDGPFWIPGLRDSGVLPGASIPTELGKRLAGRNRNPGMRFRVSGRFRDPAHV